MKVTCIGTGSEGNSYLIEENGRFFLLDAGVNLSKVIKHINLNNLDFAFVSHEHKDHSRELENLRKRGVLTIYGESVDTFKEIRLNQEIYDNWTILCFDVKHGECKNAGIIVINKKSRKSLLYLTDFTLVEYDLSSFKFDTVIIEANYIKSIADKGTDDFRVMENIKRHCELAYTIDVLKTLDLTNTKQIILCHMSQTFGDSIVMGSSVYSEFKIPTGVCQRLGGIDWYGKEEFEYE